MAKKENAKAKKQVAPPRQPTDAQLRAALTDEMDDIRAVDALIQLNARGGPSLSALLIDLATNSDDIDLRATAAHALGQKAMPKHRATLRQVVDDDEREVARRAAEAMGRIGGEAELKKLRTLRPKDPVVKRAVETAKTLLTYRTGATRGRLSVPQPSETLTLGKAKAGEIVIQAVDPEVLAGISDHLKKMLPQLPLARSAHTLECGKAQFLVVLHKDLAKKNLDTMKGKSMVAGALLRQAQIDGTYYLDGEILTHPGTGNSVRVFVMRHSGEVSHYGELALGEKSAAFNVTAMNTRHAKPIELRGSIAYRTLNITVERAKVATERAVVQPTAKRPRQMQRPAVS